jgi:hypothetical protein
MAEYSLHIALFGAAVSIMWFKVLHTLRQTNFLAGPIYYWGFSEQQLHEAPPSVEWTNHDRIQISSAENFLHVASRATNVKTMNQYLNYWSAFICKEHAINISCPQVVGVLSNASFTQEQRAYVDCMSSSSAHVVTSCCTSFWQNSARSSDKVVIPFIPSSNAVALSCFSQILTVDISQQISKLRQLPLVEMHLLQKACSNTVEIYH